MRCKSPTLSQQIARLDLSRRNKLSLVVSDPEGMKDAESSLLRVSRYTGVELLLPSRLICLNYSCPAILGPEEKYSLTVYDDAHLTTLGSKLYASAIMKALGIQL